MGWAVRMGTAGGMLPVPYDVYDSLTPSGRVMIACYIRISSCQVAPPSICAPAGEGKER